MDALLKSYADILTIVKFVIFSTPDLLIKVMNSELISLFNIICEDYINLLHRNCIYYLWWKTQRKK